MFPSMQQYKLETILLIVGFFPLAFVIGDGLSGVINCVGSIRIIHKKLQDFHKHVMCLLRNLIIQIGNVAFGIFQ